MSIAETNKLRESLGLKPLKDTSQADDAAMRKREEEQRRQQEREERAEAFKSKQAGCVNVVANAWSHNWATYLWIIS